MKYTGQEIALVLRELSEQGLVNVLSDYDHIFLDGQEDREELEKIAQCNLLTYEIDEIEFIIELSGE